MQDGWVLFRVDKNIRAGDTFSDLTRSVKRRNRRSGIDRDLERERGDRRAVVESNVQRGEWVLGC